MSTLIFILIIVIFLLLVVRWFIRPHFDKSNVNNPQPIRTISSHRSRNDRIIRQNRVDAHNWYRQDEHSAQRVYRKTVVHNHRYTNIRSSLNSTKSHR